MNELIQPISSIGQSNELIKILKAFPDKPWNYKVLSRNPNITLNYILENLDKEWDWDYLSANPAITLHDIMDHPNLNWNYRYVSGNPNITIDYVINNSDKDWHWASLSKNPGITLQNIEDNLYLSWVWSTLTYNPHMTPEFILKHTVEDRFLPDFWFCCSNPEVSLEEITKCDNMYRDKERISYHPDINLKYIFENSNSDLVGLYGGSLITNNWNWYVIAQSPKVTFQDALDHDLFEKLDEGDTLNFMAGISINPNTTIYDILENPQHRWESYIFQNPNISISEIEKYYSQLPSSAKLFILSSCLSINPNLTLEYMLQSGYDDWDWLKICNNIFTKHPFFENPLIIRI